MTVIKDENVKTCNYCNRKLINIHQFSANVLVKIHYKATRTSFIYDHTKSFEIFQQDIILNKSDYDINAITSSYLDDEDALSRELNEKLVGKGCTLEYRQNAMEKKFWWNSEDIPLLFSLKVNDITKPK